MIINTIIVFLRDLLPVFILICYLSVFLEKRKISLSFLLSIFLGSAAITLLLFMMAEFIADWHEGAGLEIASAILLSLFYLSNVYLSAGKFTLSILQKLAIFIGISTFIALKGAEFLIFFSVYGQQTSNIQNIVVACIVGLGICISFSALFRFLLVEIKRSHHIWVFTLFWCAFLAGQFSQITSLLSQVDLISSGAPMFDISAWIKDSSEYGHILNALVGYESSPTIVMAITYSIAFTIPLLSKLFFDMKYSSNEVGHA